MKSILFLLTAIWPIVFYAYNSNHGSYFKQLCEINKEWLNHKSDSPNEKVYFETDNDAIQAHLLLVCNSLTNNTPSDLNKNQLESRFQLINELREYAVEKVFPTNLYHAERTPYFVDDFGVHCAVGYLMSQSGSKDLVAQIRTNENYSYIADIKTPGVSEWASKHGFTVDELKWIQPAYVPPTDHISPLGNGANGPVNKMVSNYYNGDLIIAGEFDSLDLEACLNIGIYQNEQLSCLGTGVSGKINDIAIRDGNVIVLGELNFQGLNYTMATFEGGVWDYMNIPTREGAVATAGYSGGNTFEVAINHPSDEGLQEIWIQSGISSWEKVMTLNGTVYEIGASPYGRVFAGKISEGITYDDQGLPEDTVMTNNVFFRENYGDHNWGGISGSNISDTVRTFKSLNSQIYFGGTAIDGGNSSGVVLTRYFNNTLQPLLLASSFSGFDQVSINSIDLGLSEGSLLIGGDFFYEPMIGTYGKNIASYDVFDNMLSPLAILDKSVNSVVIANNQIYFGGDFETNLTTNELNHLGRYDAVSGVDSDNLDNKLQVFPNPFIETIEIKGINSKYTYQILDGSGRVVREGSSKSNKTIQLSDLTSGIYFLNMQTEAGLISRRLVKQ